MLQKKPRCQYLDVIMCVVVFSYPAEIILILRRVLRFQRNGDVAFRLRIGNLHIVRQEILCKQPGSEHFLRIRLIKHADRRPLGNHFRMLCVELGNCHNGGFKLHHLVRTDIQQRRVCPHPGSAGGGIDSKNTLPCIQEISGIA